jgi:tetratricopeptide (TPR) repeat protein
VAQGLAALNDRETAEAAQLHLVAGLIHARRGEREPAQERGQAAATIAEKLGELSVLASANLLLGLVRWQLSDTAEAVQRYHRALDLYQRAGDLAGQAKAQNNLANAYFKTGQWKDADEQYRRARQTFDQIGAAYNRALAENNLGGIALNQGRVEDAVSFYQQALNTVEKIGASAYVRGTVHMNLGAAYIRQQRAAEAHVQLAESRALFEQTQSRDFWPELHRHLARTALIAKDIPGAEEQANEALRAARELGMRGEEGNALRVLGEIALDKGTPGDALEPLRASVARLAEVADDYELARSQFSLARALSQLHQPAEARMALESALHTFERLDATMDANAARALREKLAITASPPVPLA